VTDLTWDSHSLQTSFTFAGKTVTSATKTLHITGLPYDMSKNVRKDKWTLSGGTAEWEDGGSTIYLNHATNNSAVLSFHAGTTVNVAIVTSLSIYTPARVATPSLVISAGGTALTTYNGESGTAKTTEFTNQSLQGSLNSANSTINYARSYKYVREGNVIIKDLKVTYR
jgi:hypothetical protein